MAKQKRPVAKRPSADREILRELRGMREWLRQDRVYNNSVLDLNGEKHRNTLRLQVRRTILDVLVYLRVRKEEEPKIIAMLRKLKADAISVQRANNRADRLSIRRSHARDRKKRIAERLADRRWDRYSRSHDLHDS